MIQIGVTYHYLQQVSYCLVQLGSKVKFYKNVTSFWNLQEVKDGD